MSSKTQEAGRIVSSPLIGLSLVWLNSETGMVEKPARKSRLLTPVTLRVWRPLQLTLGKIATSFMKMPEKKKKSQKHIHGIFDKRNTLSLQAPGRGNLRLTTRAELGMFNSSFRPCSTPTTRPWERMTSNNQCVMCIPLFWVTGSNGMNLIWKKKK